MKFLMLFMLGWMAMACSPRVVENATLIEQLMKKHPRKFKFILKNRDTLQVQIIYTQINRDTLDQIRFKSFYFHVDSTEYFYPASTVKLPQLLLAFEKLNQLKIKGLNEFTPMFSDSVYSGQRSVTQDTTSENGLPSMAHYAKKILIVSDNDAFNRLYEFVGQKETNASLKAKGYNLRIVHRLDRPLSEDQNKHTEAVRFVQHDSVIFLQPMLVNDATPKSKRKVLKGIGYMKDDGTIIHQPFSFTEKNDYPLLEQQEILKAVLFPESLDPKKRFNLTEPQRKFIMKHMSQLPSETNYPAYQKDKKLYDAYCKFLLFGNDKKKIPHTLRVFNKVGNAYGFLIDNAYIVDFKNQVEFMLSAVINVNTDGIYNDGKYAYKKIGYPFMKNIGKVVYAYELKRKKKKLPNLQSFQFSYTD